MNKSDLQMMLLEVLNIYSERTVISQLLLAMRKRSRRYEPEVFKIIEQADKKLDKFYAKYFGE